MILRKLVMLIFLVCCLVAMSMTPQRLRAASHYRIPCSECASQFEFCLSRCPEPPELPCSKACSEANTLCIETCS